MGTIDLGRILKSTDYQKVISEIASLKASVMSSNRFRQPMCLEDVKRYFERLGRDKPQIANIVAVQKKEIYEIAFMKRRSRKDAIGVEIDDVS